EFAVELDNVEYSLMKNFNFRFSIALYSLCAVYFSGISIAHAQSTLPATRLSQNSKAALSVTVAEGASERVKKTAATLAEYLSRISGGEFQIETGDGKKGLAIGTAADFPALLFGKEFDATDL